jgi:hypothetical protein
MLCAPMEVFRKQPRPGRESGVLARFGNTDRVLLYTTLALSLMLAASWDGSGHALWALAAPVAVGLAVLSGLRFHLAGAIASTVLALGSFGLAALVLDGGSAPERLVYGALLSGLIAVFAGAAALVVGYHERSCDLLEHGGICYTRCSTLYPSGSGCGRVTGARYLSTSGGRDFPDSRLRR